MSQWSYIKKPNWVGDGKDTYLATNIVATTRGWEYQPTGEVLVAISSLSIKNSDAIVAPIFTAAVSYSGTSSMVTGDVITVTLTSSEPVSVNGVPKIALTIGDNTRELVYDGGQSTDTSLVFTYTITASDSAIASGVIISGVTTGGSVYDILPDGALVTTTVSFTAPNTSTTTVN